MQMNKFWKETVKINNNIDNNINSYLSKCGSGY
jgi:hypothetical protein